MEKRRVQKKTKEKEDDQEVLIMVAHYQSYRRVKRHFRHLDLDCVL